MREKRALITGITGQDGSYLAELLLKKGYDVFGVVRRSSYIVKARIEHLYSDPYLKRNNLHLEYGDLSDGSSLRRLLSKICPDEIYNLAAQSHVRISFDQPEYTMDVNCMGVLRFLEAMRDYVEATGKIVKFYQASSSEMFGSEPPPQNEKTLFHPCSPYATAKVAGYWHTANYRQAYGLYCCNGILFNHESERRGENFVTRKITRAAGRIKVGLQKKLYLGNLNAKRDWGYAVDYVEAMWRMLQQEAADDYVIATGESHSVEEFLEDVFRYLDMDWQDYVDMDPYYFRPSEVNFLRGDSSKAREKFGWQPKTSYDDLVKIMTEHDLDLAEREIHAQKYTKQRVPMVLIKNPREAYV